MSKDSPVRILVFGATGHLGAELIARLETLDRSVSELIGVVSPESATAEIDFRGESLGVVSEWPKLRAEDVVFVCTPPGVALAVVREALRAEAVCIDCTGVLADRVEVPMPARERDFQGDAAPALLSAPLFALPSPTTLAWTRLLDGLMGVDDPIQACEVVRVTATVLCSAAFLGRRGSAALSEESIALFNQSDEPKPGPASQAVAFDVIPGAIDEARVESELARIFGAGLRVAATSLQVPAFLGEGASLAIELATPVDEADFRKRLEAIPGLRVIEDGIGSRGLAAVEDAVRQPTGPTLRDAAGAEEILVGRVRPDASLPAGTGWLLWLSYDPMRVAGDHLIRLASLRLSGR